MRNVPIIKIGIIAVSRDCFPIELSRKRRKALAAACSRKGLPIVALDTIIEKEKDVVKALAEIAEKEINALVVFLGNFGPEGPTSMLIQRFNGPAMVCAAGEENKAVLLKDRGDALCGLLSCSYNLSLRKVRAYIPPKPVGLPEELAGSVADFESIARVVVGVRNLKIISFGPRPQDFYTCHAPLRPLFDLGVEVMENSELDLLRIYREAAGKKEKITVVEEEMKAELSGGNPYPDLLPKLAQFEISLMAFMEENFGACKYAAFANKCWPSFEHEFGFVPCYVNSRLTGKGFPVACEADIYGALSEYMVQLAGLSPAALLDINNTVPDDLLDDKTRSGNAGSSNLFMGFHCGNTSSVCMKDFSLSYHVIMNRLVEDGKTPNVTRGILEGQLKPGKITAFRIQPASDDSLASYIAEGEILDVSPGTFGGTGVIHIPGFKRFYRYVLIEKPFPHHAAFGFRKLGKILYEAMRLIGVRDIASPLPDNVFYQNENPFS